MQTYDDSSDPSGIGLFSSLRPASTLVSRVSEEIEKSIEERRLKPGELLPSENEMARQFGVSRTVVREAIKGLVAKNLLEVKPGSGTYVTSPTVKSVSQSMRRLFRFGSGEADIEKILEVRKLLEVEIAGLAAERRTAEDLEDLESILQLQVECCTERDQFAKMDVEFHNALASATHNELFSILVDSIAEFLVQMRTVGYQVPGMQERSLNFHQAIYEQVRQGDKEMARQVMQFHLVEAEDTFRRALQSLQEVELSKEEES